MDGLGYQKKNIKFALIFVTLLIFQNIYAQELQREYRSAYFLGRGDTGIATATGEDAIFYNPAGIAQGKGIISEIILASPQGEATQNVNQIINSYSNSDSGSAIQFLAQNQNSIYSAAAQNYSGLIFRRVALGILERANANAYEGIAPATGIPTANIYAANRTGVYLTLARDFWDNKLFIGMNGKFIQKKELNLSISALNAETQLSNSSLSSVINNSLNQGDGIGTDLGMMLVLNKETNTQIGIVYRNIGMQYPWTTPEGSAPPTAEPTVLDAGISTTYGTKRSKITIAADIRDVTNTQNAVFGKRVHLGAEYSLMDTFGIMGGLNQGYGTYGMFLHTKIVKVEGGMYTEELGARLGEYPSQRLFARVVLGWLL
ncbi:hypothetical protein [Silvanigrella aquatica]|uniref:PorV/PorQ family protein n=1 Tax=Silvanigrella aquatica TaxID=1915309 RepID=A0A1L4CYC1_9BACT|nr:hypothetical protein [Silvanigrella aquatica]APJ02937.1 hypothetical protein AXG55_03005 [Silvanigrella aquatica]